MKRILLLTTMLLALIAGKVTAQGNTYRVPEQKDISELNDILGNNDVIVLTGNVTGTLNITKPNLNLTIQNQETNSFTFGAITLSQNTYLTLTNITVEGINLNGQHGSLDVTLKTEGNVTVSSGIKASSLKKDNSYKLTIDGSKGNVVIFQGATGESESSPAAALEDFDVIIQGGQPQFIYNGNISNINAFESKGAVTITNSNPTFTTTQTAMKAQSLTITGNSSPTFSSTMVGSALSLDGGNLIISSSGECKFQNSSVDFNTIHFEKDAELNVNQMNGILRVTNSAKYLSGKEGSAIYGKSKLLITGTSGENGKIIATGAHSAIRAKPLEIEATTRIEANLNGKGNSIAAIHTETPLTIKNADITIGEGSRDGISTVGGITMESGSLTISDQIDGELTLGPDASLIINKGLIAPNAGFSLINYGTFINKGSFTNRTTLTNYGMLRNEGVFANDTSSVIHNYGILTNEMNSSFTNKGTLNNEATGKIINKGLTNDAASVISKGVSTKAELSPAIFINEVGATLNNKGVIENEGEFTNKGTLTNEGTLTHKTNATLSNEIGSTLDNKGSFIVDGDITNNGLINNYNTIEGNGKISGNEVVEHSSQNSTYYTIALIVEEGIHSNYSAGDLTIAENEHLHLTFFADDPALTAADILFMIDGVEADFKASGNGGSYILNPITKDQSVVIALREYPVTFPEIEGLTITPQGKAKYGEAFTFIINSKTLDLSQMKVFANGTELTPNTFRAENYTYTIECITCPLDITIEGANPTSNAHIASGKVSIAMDNGQLRIENSGNAVDIAVYTIAGKNVVSLRGLRGSRTFALLAGIYIVRAGNTTNKLIIQN